MAVDSNIVDPANGHTAEVGVHRQLIVSERIPDIPPRGEVNRYTFFNALVGASGAVESGLVGANMNVDGSSTESVFYIGSEPKTDIRVMKIAVIIADSAVAHSAFGNVSALANGFSLTVTEQGIDTNLLSDAKTGGQMIAQSALTGAYGDGATSFELTNWTGNTDAQTIVIDVAALVPGGIRIARGSQDRIYATVADNLTGLTEFTVRVLGYRHHE